MELIIFNPTEEQFIQNIEWNHEELKTQIGNELAKYNKMVFTEDTVQDGKRSLADLRRFKTAIEDKRKAVKAQVMAPYNDFEKKVKEITALIDEPIKAIDSQVKEFDERRREEKLQECETYFNEKAEELGLTGFIRWESLLNESYGNVSYSMGKITEEIDSALKRVLEALAVIDGMDSPFAFEMRQTLSETLDLQSAISRGQQLKETAEQKARFEAERIAEQERRAAERDEKAKVIETAGTVKEIPMAKDEPAAAVEETPQLLTISFQVTGTKEELMALSVYLKTNNLKYTQI